MPDFSKCRYVNGKMYCWDRTKKWLAEVTVTPLDFSLNSRETLDAFIAGGDNRAENQCPEAQDDAH